VSPTRQDSKPISQPNAGPKLKVADWTEQFTVQGGDGHKSRIECVAFSPDGATLASASIDATVKLWNVATGKLKRTITVDYEARPLTVAFAPDGKSLAFGGARDPWATLADPTTGKVLRQLKDPSDKNRGPFNNPSLRSLAYMRDGKTLATGGDDDTVRLMDPATGALKHAIPAEMYSVSTLAFSPDERSIAAAGGSGISGTIRLWDVANRKELAAVKGLKKAIYSLAFSPDGKLLATASAGNDITLWEVSGTAIKEVATFRGYADDHAMAECVCFTPDGRTLLAGSGTTTKGGIIQIIDVSSRKVRDSVACPIAIRCLAISADGKSMAVGSKEHIDLQTIKDIPPKLILLSAIR
jgi:WD40 repeat protein